MREIFFARWAAWMREREPRTTDDFVHVAIAHTGITVFACEPHSEPIRLAVEQVLVSGPTCLRCVAAKLR